jgi:hypothetical protein
MARNLRGVQSPDSGKNPESGWAKQGVQAQKKGPEALLFHLLLTDQ